MQIGVARRSRRALLRASTLASLLLAAASSSAGGFEIPDNGAEAMGRGAAFVAKASDGTAIYWNPAGLARQRGTHVLVDANLYLHSFHFQRAGSYPDDPNDQERFWGGQPYPQANNSGGPLLKPFAAVTTDFGYFDRLTVGAGIFTPPTISNRTFTLDIAQAPSPTRYDFVQARSSFLYPTLSVGFRVTPWLDIGVSGHLVLADFDETSVSYADFGPPACKDDTVDGEKLREDYRCDVRTNLQASAKAFAATAGVMVRPSASLAFGATFRTPTNINAIGTLTPVDVGPGVPNDQQPQAGAASYALQLPWAVRVGGRYIGMDADFELYDLELDLTYEAWGTAQRLGPVLTVPDFGAFKDIQAVVQHGYKNTYGVRAGGAYNIDTGDGILSLRGGAYFDSPATSFATTRLDYDTLAKIAGTFGIGFDFGPAALNLSYAAIASIPRTVGIGDGDIRPINLHAGGATEGAGGPQDQLSAVNEGGYTGFTHLLAAGLTVPIDRFFGPPRRIHYGNAYEPNYVSDDEPKPSTVLPREEKKPEEKKPEEKKPEEKTPEEKKPESERLEPDEPSKRPLKPAPIPEDDEDRPVMKKPAAPPPPPPPPKVEEKPATRRHEWWEEPE